MHILSLKPVRSGLYTVFRFGVLFAVFLALCCLARPASANDTDIVSGEILVGFHKAQDTPFAAKALLTYGQRLGYSRTLAVHRIKLRAGLNTERTIEDLRRRADVRFAEPNRSVRLSATPNDPSYSSQQYALPLIAADQAWDIWNPRAAVVIAIVDTGVDNGHPDLTNKIYRDANGIVGYDAFTGFRDDALDVYGHGTHCAGIAAAQINNGANAVISTVNYGIAGVAGWDGKPGTSDTTYIKIMPIKVLDNTGSGTLATVADGITWAADHGAKVISLSLGTSSFSDTLNDAVQYAWNKGCIIVGAAGNGQTTNKLYPGGCDNALPVAATDSSDTLAWFSNYGSWIKVTAPGMSIWSTTPSYSQNNQYYLWYSPLSGTSMSTPHVAGEAALLMAQNPFLTNAQVKEFIENNVDPYTPYSGRTLAANGGRINVYDALAAATPVKTLLTTVDRGPATTGSTVILSALLATSPGGAPLFGQTLTFKVAGATVGTSVTDALGSATLNYTIPESLGTGNKTITVEYADNVNYYGSSASATLNVSNIGTSLTTVKRSGWSIGATLTPPLSATLLRTSDNAPLSGQLVTFKIAGSTIGTGTTDVNGVANAAYTIPESLGIGDKAITVEFAGSGPYSPSAGSNTLNVVKSNTGISTGKRGPFATGTTLTLSAILRRNSDNSFLSGKTVTFKVQGSVVGTGTTNASGVANLSYTIPASLGTGNKTVTVEFAGTTLYNPSSHSNTLTVK